MSSDPDNVIDLNAERMKRRGVAVAFDPWQVQRFGMSWAVLCSDDQHVFLGKAQTCACGKTDRPNKGA